MSMLALHEPDGSAMNPLPPRAGVSIRQFAAQRTAPGLARRHAADTLRAWGLDSIVEAAELVVSELVTNAAQASHRPSRNAATDRSLVAMRLSCFNTSVIVEIWDHDERTPIRRKASREAESGRGLLIVEALSAQWAFYRPPAGGTVVWSQLALPAEATPRLFEAREPTVPLARREATTEPGHQIEVFDDLAVLQRVADGLRALDWNLPGGDVMRY